MMAWQQEVEEISLRRTWANEMGGGEAVARHHGKGHLTVRERIASLCDTGTFREIGGLAGSSKYSSDGKIERVVPAPYVMGIGRIDGQPVAIGGEDFTVRGGTSWGSARRKGGQGGFVEDLAHEMRVPLVNLIDGAGGTVASLQRRGYSVFPGVDGFERSVELLGEVPVVSAVLGTAAGGPAGRAILSHFSVMVRGSSQIFAAGPPVVRRSLGQEVDKDELGGAAVAVDVAGTIHNAAGTEVEAFEQIRRFLSYMPRNVWQLPPTLDGGIAHPAMGELISIVPRKRTRPYNMRRLIELIVDQDATFEIQPTFGKSVITSLARLEGHVVGIIANNPLHLGGAMDVKSARKQTHFMEMCDLFHIPLIFLVDVPGFMVGVEAERAATLREGMRAVYVAGQLTIPTVTVVIRKCYGMAGMATCNKNGLDLKIAWPSAEWGSLPLEGGAAAAFRREIEASPDPKRREQELEAELRQLASPFRTAEAFAVEDMVSPLDTRSYLVDFVRLSVNRRSSMLGLKPRLGVGP